MPTSHSDAISKFFLKLSIVLGILVVAPVLILFIAFQIFYYIECEMPPSHELVEGIVGGPFENVSLKVLDGAHNKCNWGDSDVLISATFTSRDGTGAFIDEIAKEYHLTRESDTVFSYYYHDGGNKTMQIRCDRQTNICKLTYVN